MARSFIKWLGGKSQLLKYIVPQLPEFEILIEPFCGSASLFFDIFDNQDIFKKPYKKCILNDINDLLTNAHKVVANNLSELIPFLKEKESLHSKEYYKIQGSRVKDLKIEDNKIEAASLFIYLNKASFNGLWRLNSSGGFNADWNKKNHINLVTDELIECSELLGKYAEIYCTSYENIIEKNEDKNAFFFIDPPYVPISATASFVSYTKYKWSEKDTTKLRDLCNLINKRNQKFMFTNSNAPIIYELFKDYNIIEVEANRKIKASSDRPKVKETIVKNY